MIATPAHLIADRRAHADRRELARVFEILRSAGLAGPMILVAATLVAAPALLVLHWVWPQSGWPCISAWPRCSPAASASF
jgi:hypothetical protein